jgi:hypothetical protein
MSELSTIGKIMKALELAKVAQTGVELTYFDAIELLGHLKILEETIGLFEEERDALKEAGRWIPVEERLPEDGRWSMVIDCEYPTRIFIGVYEPEEREFYDHAGDSIGSPDRHITHWMPLPQPPQAQS